MSKPHLRTPIFCGLALALAAFQMTAVAQDRARGDAASEWTVLRGRVEDPFGQPIHGAQLTVLRRPADTFSCPDPAMRQREVVVTRQPTRFDGSFAAQVPRGLPVRVRIDVESYAVELRRNLFGAMEGAAAPVVIRLQEACGLDLRVLTEDGASAPDAKVLLRRGDWHEPYLSAEETGLKVGADGRLTFSRLKPLRYLLELQPVDGAPQSWVSVDLRTGALAEAVELRYPKSSVLRGKVLDATSGKPVAGARVSLNFTMRPQVLTDQHGLFALPGARSPERRALRVRASGYAPDEVRVPPPEVGAGALVTVDLERGRSVTGRVFRPGSGGRPLEGCDVSLIAIDHSGNSDLLDIFTTQTDARGRWRLTDFRGASMEYCLYLRHVRYATLSFAVPVEGGLPPALREITMRRRQIFSGRVIDWDGKPRVGIEVTLVGANEDHTAHVDATGARHQAMHYVTRRIARTRAPDGRFDFGDLPPGDYNVFHGRRMILEDVEIAADVDPQFETLRF